jgi:hypothetical protein
MHFQSFCKRSILLKFPFALKPLEVSATHNHTLTSHKTPQKNYRPCNVIPGHRPTAVRPNSGEPAAGTGRERAEEDQRGLVARFRSEFEVVGASARLHSGGDRCLPRCPPVPVRWSHDSGYGRASSFGGG